MDARLVLSPLLLQVTLGVPSLLQGKFAIEFFGIIVFHLFYFDFIERSKLDGSRISPRWGRQFFEIFPKIA